jgi:tetratricopeptide (TPR) repeat protein
MRADPPSPAPPVAAATAVQTAAPSAEVEPYLARARQYLEVQELALAQAELEKADQIAPRHREVVFLLGDVAYRGLKMEAAERHYRAATELDPHSAAAFGNLALVLLELGEAKEAVWAARKAVGNDGDPRYRALLGQALLRLGDPREAAELLESALAKGVGGAERWASLGRARDLSGQKEAALRAYDEAVRRDPWQPLVHYWRAEHLRKAGRHREADEALATYRRCRDLLDRIGELELSLGHDPSDATTLLSLARLRVERGIPSQAVPLVMRVEQVAPSHPRLASTKDLVKQALAKGPDVDP